MPGDILFEMQMMFQLNLFFLAHLESESYAWEDAEFQKMGFLATGKLP